MAMKGKKKEWGKELFGYSRPHKPFKCMLFYEYSLLITVHSPLSTFHSSAACLQPACLLDFLLSPSPSPYLTCVPTPLVPFPIFNLTQHHLFLDSGHYTAVGIIILIWIPLFDRDPSMILLCPLSFISPPPLFSLNKIFDTTHWIPHT